jgi:hypothetical protein
MPNSNDVASNEMLWERVLSLLVVAASVLGGSTVSLVQALPPLLHGFSVGAQNEFDCDHEARNRHSDNEEFCNDLNRPKTPKMSEQSWKTLQDFLTSKLNTRVRFTLAAPSAELNDAQR